MIPIVRRTVTVTTTQLVEMPFSCPACGLQTQAALQIQGVGKSSALYISADADAAKQRAYANAQVRARSLVAECPCPRCGAIPEASRRALAAWEQKTAVRKKRRPFVGLGVLAAAVVFAGSCGLLVVAVNGDKSDHGAGGGLVSLCFWVVVGAVAAAIAYGVAGPPRRPNVPTQVPPNVRFPYL